MTPTATNKLCGASNNANGCIADADGTTPGWQGTITVKVTLDGAPVTTGNANLSIGGLAFVNKPLDATGSATFANSSLAEGSSVVLVAQTDDIQGRGVGMATLNMLVDTIPPSAPPTALVAATLDRRATSFTLSWTAPADVGQPTVGGYDIHAKVANAMTMDPCGTEVKTVPFAGTPKASGGAETFNVTGLLIETSYCFTVAATDEVGNVGPSAKAGAIARFNQTILSPPSGGPSNERFGYSLDGSSDFNGDKLSDLLVGGYSNPKAYLFLGKANFATSAPSTTFSGSTNFFGYALAPIGDVDGDGRADLAITSPLLGTGKVFIFKGRQTWPAALTEADADYVISTDASYMGAGFGSSLAALGDFNGDGVSDFAIGAYTYASGVGRVVVVLGKAVGFSSITLPDPTNTIVFDGDPALPKGGLGYRVLGLGHFYPGSGTTLVASGVGQLNQPGSTGQVYAFRGRSAQPGPVPITSADAVRVGPAANARIGYQLTNLGPIAGTLPGVGIGAPFYNSVVPTSNGYGFLYGGDATMGPFAGKSWLLYDSAATNSSDAFGSVLFGGGISGSDAVVSIIGDGKPDVAVVPARLGGGTASIYIINGASMTGRPNFIDVATSADVTVALPLGWAGTTNSSQGLIQDIDGDGYGDFAVGEFIATIPGRVAVFW